MEKFILKNSYENVVRYGDNNMGVMLNIVQQLNSIKNRNTLATVLTAKN